MSIHRPDDKPTEEPIPSIPPPTFETSGTVIATLLLIAALTTTGLLFAVVFRGCQWP